MMKYGEMLEWILPFLRHYFVLAASVSGAHGATDITGFGVLGHASNLAAIQKEAVSFHIHSLPS